MILFIILITTELLTILVIRQHFKASSKANYYISVIINSILSIYLWVLYVKLYTYKGYFDDMSHIYLMMSLTGAICAIVIPRVILDIFHLTGSLIMIRKGGHIRSLTNAGIMVFASIFTIIVWSSTIGKFNFKTSEINLEIPGLNKNLEGLTIVQLSDIHLAGFYRYRGKLAKVVEKVNSYKPDILINSGDFINYGWREFDNMDTLLSGAKGKLGSFAAIGNHDIGTYNPDLNEAGRDSNLVRMNELIKASGYNVLNDENTFLNIGPAKVAIIGVITEGKHPRMVHGDLSKAIKGTDSADFRILISHDPNHWEEAVKGKTKIELTFAGHTHGMQMGILTGGFKWSPSQYFYPKWNGLYNSGNQFLYVNRGLGVLAIPFRIWMPPEITVIKLTSK
jgi:predicted MPP superfamily phosphohydrolase